MTVNVRETFLNHPEDRYFGIVGQTAKIGRKVNGDGFRIAFAYRWCLKQRVAVKSQE